MSGMTKDKINVEMFNEITRLKKEIERLEVFENAIYEINNISHEESNLNEKNLLNIICKIQDITVITITKEDM